MKGDTTSQKKDARKLEFESWLEFTNFRIWRMNLSSEVSSCASRPIEAMIWINKFESSRPTADLKKPYSITRAKLQTNFELLDSKNSEWSQ